jgi:hypothetical protein
MNKQQYTELLRKHNCTVTFTKKDGTSRTMKCTLDSDYIADNGLTPVGGGASVPDTQVRCVDTEKNAWRSFTVDSVSNFTID